MGADGAVPSERGRSRSTTCSPKTCRRCLAGQPRGDSNCTRAAPARSGSTGRRRSCSTSIPAPRRICGVLPRRALDLGDVREPWPAELRQDVRQEGPSGVRAAQLARRPTSRPSRSRAPSPSCWRTPPGPGRLAHGQDAAPGQVLVDWSQNDEHKTTVCVYSLRARERPTMSTPLAWEEVERGARHPAIPASAPSRPTAAARRARRRPVRAAAVAHAGAALALRASGRGAAAARARSVDGALGRRRRGRRDGELARRARAQQPEHHRLGR